MLGHPKVVAFYAFRVAGVYSRLPFDKLFAVENQSVAHDCDIIIR